MKISILDPSGFSLPYDNYLCASLAETNNSVFFYTRPFRKTDDLFENDLFISKRIYYKQAELLRENGYSEYIYNTFKVFNHIHSTVDMYKDSKVLRPDVIHYQWLPIPLIDYLWLEKLRKIAPLIITVHDTKPFHGSPTSKFQLLRWLDSIKRFDAVIVHTKYSKEQLVVKGIDQSKVYIVPHGLFNYMSPKVDNVYKTNKKLQILYFGIIKPYKGIDILLRAYAKLSVNIRENSTLVVCGYPKMDMKYLLQLAKKLQLNNINWDLRYIPSKELNAIFYSADIIVFPYREIDASGALMAALPFKKPIIASDIGCFNELLSEGVHAYLVPVENVDALSEALAKLLSSQLLREKMSTNICELVDTYPTWHDIAKMTIQVYKKVKFLER